MVWCRSAEAGDYALGDGGRPASVAAGGARAEECRHDHRRRHGRLEQRARSKPPRSLCSAKAADLTWLRLLPADPPAGQAEPVDAARQAGAGPSLRQDRTHRHEIIHSLDLVLEVRSLLGQGVSRIVIM